MASICPSSRSGETDGRSRSLPSRTGLRRETRALVLGGIEEATMDDAEVETPDRSDAISDALSEFMPSPRLAANSLRARTIVKLLTAEDWSGVLTGQTRPR